MVQLFRAVPRRLAPALALVLGASVVPASSALSAAPADGTAGIGDPYFPFDGNGGIDVLHYDVRDRYGLADRELSGRTTLTVRATAPLTSFNLDFLLRVREVRIDGARVAFTGPDEHELQITPDAEIPAGERFSVTSATPASPERSAGRASGAGSPRGARWSP